MTNRPQSPARHRHLTFLLAFGLTLVSGTSLATLRAPTQEPDSGSARNISLLEASTMEIPEVDVRLPVSGDNPPNRLLAVVEGKIDKSQVAVPANASGGQGVQAPAFANTARVIVEEAPRGISVVTPATLAFPPMKVQAPNDHEPGAELELGGMTIPMPHLTYRPQELEGSLIPAREYEVDLFHGYGELAPIGCSGDGVCPLDGILNSVSPVQANASASGEGLILSTPGLLVESPSSPEINVGGGTVYIPPPSIGVPAMPGQEIILPPHVVSLEEVFPVGGPILATPTVTLGAMVVDREIILGSGALAGTVIDTPIQRFEVPPTLAEVKVHDAQAFLRLDSLVVALPAAEVMPDNFFADNSPPQLQRPPPIQPTPVTPPEYPLSGSAPCNLVDGATNDQYQLCVVVPTDPLFTALTGRVSFDDANVTPSAGAKVTVSLPNHELTATTDALGQFAFTNIPVGVPSGLVPATVTVYMPVLPLSVQVPHQIVAGYLLDAGEGSGVHILVEGPDVHTIPRTTGATGSSMPEASSIQQAAYVGAGVAAYGDHHRPPPVIEILMKKQTSDCGDAGVTRGTKRFYWKFYVLHVVLPEVEEEFSFISGRARKAEYLRANVSAISNFAWRHQLNGTLMDNTASHFQCFDPHVETPEWWNAESIPALQYRVTAGDAIQLTQYKGYDDRYPPDQACSPPYLFEGTYQMNQVEARYCADAGWTWTRIISEYYLNPLGWSLNTIEAPGKPNLSFPSRSDTSVTIAWDSPPGWVIQVYRHRWDRTEFVCDPDCGPRYTARFNEILRGGTDIVRSGCRCIPSQVEDPVKCGKLYRYRVRAYNPWGWGEFRVNEVISKGCR